MLLSARNYFSVPTLIFAIRFLLFLVLSQLSVLPAYAENLSISDQTRFKTISQRSSPVTTYTPLTGKGIPVGTKMLYLEDKEHLESINTILKRDHHWKTIYRKSPNFGFTSSAFWFKFAIDNTSSNTESIYLELPIPFLDNIEIYQREKHTILAQHVVGDTYPFEQRPIIHQNFVMPFTLKPGKNEMIMRVSSAGTVEAPLILWSPTDHAKFSSDDHMLQGIWAGIIGIMIVYNLLLFISIREESYLYYVVFSFGYLFFQISLKGYGFAYIWPEAMNWNSYAISTFIGICNLSIVLLNIKFLNLKVTNPRARNVMSVVAVISALSLVASIFAPYSLTIRLNSTLALVICCLSLILGYAALLKGQDDARNYCLAWTATFTGVSILGAVKFGFLGANFWTNNAGQIGVVFLVSLLSFALANRINREKELRLSAQESVLNSEKRLRESQAELLEAQTSINAQLEAKVAERTQSMQRALTELEQANNRLELASTTDSLTTLFNRRHFESRLVIEFKRAQRHQRELSIILCDIDHFKAINDNFGHKTGDECLRHVSVILKNTITRSGDIISRYGGEEFIVLLVDTSIEEAEYLANTLCREFSHSAFESEGNIIEFTASFGVSSLTQEPAKRADELVSRADIALYQAKGDGRNTVKLWQPSPEPSDYES